VNSNRATPIRDLDLAVRRRGFRGRRTRTSTSSSSKPR